MESHPTQPRDTRRPWANHLRLGGELAFDLAVMYLVMYTMIATLEHLRFKLNNLYMTLMMVTPMAIVMVGVDAVDVPVAARQCGDHRRRGGGVRRQQVKTIAQRRGQSQG